jgi:ABC-type bacteriocin/lantibiotic exporter with double-glycine peptidase domain
MIVILASIYWSRADQGLSIAVAFTSLSIIALVTQPLTMIIASMMQIGGVVGGFGRIQAFLELPEQVDGRISSAHDDIVTEKDVSIDAATSSEAELRLLPPFVAQTDVIHAPVVKIEEATFTTDDDTVLLQDISLEITKATLNMIVGRVGCGKSCLIKAITGELCHKAGSVTIARKSVAYCDQTAWLRNATVRANIINQSSFEEKWLETVIQACALEEDIERFPNGDETLVGSGGIALSGGQKQRVVS